MVDWYLAEYWEHQTRGRGATSLEHIKYCQANLLSETDFTDKG